MYVSISPTTAGKDEKRTITERYKKEISQKINMMKNKLKKGLPACFSQSENPHADPSKQPGVQPTSIIARSDDSSVRLELAAVSKCAEDDLRSIAQHWHTRALEYRRTGMCLN